MAWLCSDVKEKPKIISKFEAPTKTNLHSDHNALSLSLSSPFPFVICPHFQPHSHLLHPPFFYCKFFLLGPNFFQAPHDFNSPSSSSVSFIGFLTNTSSTSFCFLLPQEFVCLLVMLFGR